MSSLPNLRRAAVAVLLAVLALSGALPPGGAIDALGADPHAAVDAAAPGGRFVVIWRDRGLQRPLPVGASAIRSDGDAQRSTVTAAPGRAAAVAAALRRDPRVLMVVPDARVKAFDWPADGSPPDDLLFPRQADLEQIHVPEVWKTTTGDPNVIVAFIDSGSDLAHPDLEGVHVVAPRNETFNSTDVNDTVGHGTHTSGTVFARANNEIGIAGIAPGASFMPIKILDGNGAGFFSDLLDGVDWARTHGARIVSMSVGTTLTADQVTAFQPTFTAARAAGMLLVAAAGNDGTITHEYPAALHGVVSVAAVDGTDTVAPWSTFNSAVDIAAPGVDLLSTSISDPSGYERMSGTSMATPHVAGVAALIWSARPTLDVAQLEAVLRSSAKDLGAPGRDDFYGSGRVDALAALTAPVPNPLPNLEPPPASAGPFTFGFSRPAAPVRQRARSYTTAWAANHEPSDALVVRIAWRVRGGGCPGESAPAEDSFVLPYLSPQLQEGLQPGFCYRWDVQAIDDQDQVLEAMSAPVTVLDTVRPTATLRWPQPGATRVGIGSTIRVAFSEDVVGVSRTTIRVENLSTGLWIRARVGYAAAGHVATITPVARLFRATRYRVALLAGIRDQSNNRLQPVHWAFRTAP